jgi:outer membrane lipoprotein LolB
MLTLSIFRFIPSLSTSGKTTALALSAMLLAGCAGITPQADNTSPADITQAAANRTYRDAIDFDGRLSVQYQQNDKDESIHGSFTWHQTAQKNTITLLSPLGQILATIDVESDSATLTQSGHPPRTAPDVDELAIQSLGWPLPIGGLRTWLQGFAVDANNKPFIATPANNKVTTREGWQIQYVTWDESNPAQIHPKRIDLTRQTEQAGNVAIRIVLDNWQPR